MAGVHNGKSVSSMTMHDLWIVLDKAQVDHSQLKVKKDLRAAVERLPPLPPAGTRAAGGDGSAAAAAAAAAGFSSAECAQTSPPRT